ncbi:lipase secretion chaperone [Piscinibacter gummiphilus]|uniref:Lipase helper protein n=1 Tax=Piscinibacter gummiphilus TaxID=946333 RepID=A0ABZ0D1K5_9BURK|nr:lipase secretion chaperone [Piscinibacter gummiphilus]WOB09341.1 lipase secretion chaperone [Piscinibacter gummiphilus]
MAVAVGYRMWAPEPSDAAPLAATAPQAVGTPRGPANEPSGASAAAASSSVMVADASGATLDAARLFELGFAGGLVIDRDTRAVIEAVLNSMPEHPSAADLQRLERTLREGLPREDAERALKLFGSYRDYTADVRQQMEPLGVPRNLQEMNAFFDQMEAIKHRHFDTATAQALFGAADMHARVSMEAMFVDQDPSLTLEQKKQRLDELRARLPPEQQSLIPQPSQPAS